MGPWRLLLVGVFAVAGLVAVAPQLWNHLVLRSAPGQILAVFVDHVGAGEARLAVAYDFAVPSPRGEHVQQAFGIAGRGGRGRQNALVLPAAEAADLAARIRAQPVGMVFYAANDPEGTAFIMPYASRDLRHYAGFALMVLALLFCLPTPRWRRQRRTA